MLCWLRLPVFRRSTPVQSAREDLAHDIGQRLIGQVDDLDPSRTFRRGGGALYVRNKHSQFEREMSEYVPHRAGQLAPSRSGLQSRR